MALRLGFKPSAQGVTCLGYSRKITYNFTAFPRFSEISLTYGSATAPFQSHPLTCTYQLFVLVLPDDIHFMLFVMFLTPIIMVLFTSLTLASYVPRSSQFPTCGVRIALGHLARGAIPLIRYLAKLRQHKAI